MNMARGTPKRAVDKALADAAEHRRAQRGALAERVKALRAEGLTWSEVRRRLPQHALSHLQRLAKEAKP